MLYEATDIERVENTGSEPALSHDIIRLNPSARIIDSRVLGPVFLNRMSQTGPDVVVGQYFGMNENCFVAGRRSGFLGNSAHAPRSTLSSIPVDWLSIREFQYHPHSFDWVPEYNEIARLERTSDMFHRVTIGNDVWGTMSTCCQVSRLATAR